MIAHSEAAAPVVAAKPPAAVLAGHSEAVANSAAAGAAKAESSSDADSEEGEAPPTLRVLYLFAGKERRCETIRAHLSAKVEALRLKTEKRIVFVFNEVDLLNDGVGQDLSREAVWERMVEPERTADADKKGYAVLIAVERAEDLLHNPLEA